MKRVSSKYLSFARQFVGISLISFALGETSLRFFNFFRPSYIFYHESYNKRFRGTPFAPDGNFKLNSLGFKDKEFTPKAQNGYRIVALGDSFAVGVVPYERNYLTLIEDSLQKIHPHVDLLNMGIVGTGPFDYWELLREEALSFKPDMVLLSFFIGNDFAGPPRRRWYEYSYLATLLYRASRIARSYRGPLPTGTDVSYCDDCATMTEARYLNIEGGRSKKFIRGDTRFAKSVDIAFAYLEKIHELCKARGIKFVVALIPDELQINQDLQRSVREKFHSKVDLRDWDMTLPNRAIAARLSGSGIDYIDLYDSFIAVSGGTRLYKPRDSHWNIAGNQLAANVITAHIDKLLK